MRSPEGLHGQAEQRINRRLKISNGVQRTALGLGVLAGVLAGADLATNGAVGLPWEASAATAAALGVAGATERTLARRAASNTVTNYEVSVGADPGSHRWSPVHEGRQYIADPSYLRDPFETTYPLLDPYFGWAGGSLASIAAMSEQVAAIGERAPVTLMGTSLVGAAILLGEAEQSTHRKLKQVYRRQLDNVDASVASKRETE